MAGSALRALAGAALAIATGACDQLAQRSPFAPARSSVTIKLPPARPPTPAPGFVLDGEPQPAKPELR